MGVVRVYTGLEVGWSSCHVGSAGANRHGGTGMWQVNSPPAVLRRPVTPLLSCPVKCEAFPGLSPGPASCFRKKAAGLRAKARRGAQGKTSRGGLRRLADLGWHIWSAPLFFHNAKPRRWGYPGFRKPGTQNNFQVRDDAAMSAPAVTVGASRIELIQGDSIPCHGLPCQ